MGNKSFRTGENSLENHWNFKNIQLGVVVSLHDKNALGRIKVRIKGSRVRGGDDGVSNDDLPFAIPMIPSFVATKPKIGEAVYIFVFDRDREHSDRMYIGPIISQPPNLGGDSYESSALAGFTFSTQEPNVDPFTIPDLQGVFPNPEDISIQGRYNTEVTQKKNEVIIKAGKFMDIPAPNGRFTPRKDTYAFKFNSKTMGYIQIKNDAVVEQPTPQQPPVRGTITNIVSNKINLLTHAKGSPRFDLTNNRIDDQSLISDTEMAIILKTAHQVPFGDIMIEWMDLCEKAIIGHEHNPVATDRTDSDTQPLTLFKEGSKVLKAKMLSKNIRIN